MTSTTRRFTGADGRQYIEDCEVIPADVQGDCYPVDGEWGGEQDFEVDRTIYDRALEVGPPQFADDQIDDECLGKTVKRKVIRQVTVPYTRRVKVPVKSTKVIPCMEEKRVRTTKLVECPVMKLVDEEYTEIEERQAVRDKEIWVKKIVPETYIERVPVKKIRQVQKPGIEIREVEDWQTVQVPSSRTVEVDGFRVDEVEDQKMVEVEEFQEFELKPVATGNAFMYKTTDLGRVGGRGHLARSVGEEVYHPRSNNLRGLDCDSEAGGPGGVPPFGQPAAGQARPFIPAGPPPVATRGGVADQRVQMQRMPVPVSRPTSAMVQGEGSGPPGSLGVVVMNTHTRHTDGTGVVVTKINKGGPAEASGLQTNDIITAVGNQPTLTVSDFRNVIARIPGPLRLSVNRDGRRNLQLCIYRS